MVATKRLKQLEVLMNGLIVGRLEKKANGVLSFQYNYSWLETEGARPISLSFPLVSSKYEGEKVYNFFDNLLPDNWSIRSRIQTKFKASSDQPFELLSHIGKDCIGAIQLLDEVGNDVKKINATPMSNSDIASLLLNYNNAPLGMQHTKEDFRISIAGAQEKTALLYHDNQWKKPIGITPTTHIFKLPIGHINHQNIDLSDSCENEWLCSQIAKAYHLDVAESSIEYFDGIKALVVERFDRKLSNDSQWILRIPQEDMCQALGYSSNLKYQADGGPGIKEIMNLLLGSANTLIDRKNFFKSQILFWLLAAIDGHAKNFSVFIHPYGRFRLTPLYDIMSAYPLIKKNQLSKHKIKMAMALKGKNQHYHWEKLQRRHLLTTAKASKYSEVEANKLIIDMMDRIESVIAQVEKLLPSDFPDIIASSIFSGMRSVKNKLVT